MNTTGTGGESSAPLERSALVRLALEAPASAIGSMVEALVGSDEERSEIGALGLARRARLGSAEVCALLVARAAHLATTAQRRMLPVLARAGEAGALALFDLAQREPNIAIAAEQALASMSLEWLVPGLDDSERRSTAISALARKESVPADIAARLASELFEEPDRELRALLAWAVGRATNGAAFLRRALSDPDLTVHAFALGGLAAQSSLVEADLALVLSALDGADPVHRDAVLRGLGRAERLPATFAGALAARSRSTEADARADLLRATGAALHEPSPDDETAFLELICALEDRSFTLRAASAEGLARAGDRWAERAVGPLAEHAVTPTPDDQFFISIPAVFAAAHLARLRPEAIGVLSKNLASAKSGAVRAAAATILGEVGPQARIALTALVTALEDPEGLVVIRSAAALVALGETELGMPVIERYLQNERPVLRSQAAFTLGRLPTEADRSIRGLMRATRDSAAVVRRMAIESLSRWGREAERARPEIMARLDDEESIVRRQAVRALEDIEEARVRVQPVLKERP
jgi:HEAT repeat protein